VFTWLALLSDRVRHAGRRRRWSPDHALGRRGEDMAHRFLERAGMRVVARNYRTPNNSGEIDLVAWDSKTLVFVEVKSRQNEEYGAPDRAIDREKIDRMRRAAFRYARQANVEWRRVRFDVVSIVFDSATPIRHERDAFAVNGRIS
jgi:putative endonuclease